MAESPVSPNLPRFISEHIHSVEQLEILRLLVESAAKWWSVPDMFGCIQSTEISVKQCLEYLVKQNLAVKSSQGLFRFSPEISNLTKCAVALIETYRERRVAVIEAIYSKSDPAQHFAEAFRLRRDKS